jgi:hypothetical protein
MRDLQPTLEVHRVGRYFFVLHSTFCHVFPREMMNPKPIQNAVRINATIQMAAGIAPEAGGSFIER